MQPDSCNGIDGIAENHFVVVVEMLSPFGLFHELIHALCVGEIPRNEVVGEEIGVLRNAAHVVPSAGVACSPSVIVVPGADFLLHSLHQRRERQG